MALHPDFPADPHAILPPEVRWYPGEEMLGQMGYAMLLPPLVHEIRKGVKAWRDSAYAGASETSRALLRWWFQEEHPAPVANGLLKPFRYYFAQREAVETAVWLYEVEGARDPYALMRYDASRCVARGMFDEDWTRYVFKLATGAGKTKVMSLLIAWSYFHRLYEPDSTLSTNFLVIAPNIIVLDRLRVDFDGLRIFRADPILPPNGWEGRDWDADFQPTLHVQDEIGHVSESGNLFLTNIHRVYESEAEPSFEDEDRLDYFLGPRPKGKTTDSRVDLGRIVREVPHLLVLNDEAHHIHDPSLAWFRSIEEIVMGLRQKGSELSGQFDLSATPKHESGAIFAQTVSDYPLVEAIRQGVVKTPVLPDEPSRAKLRERKSAKFSQRYEDYLHLGVLEWRKAYEELSKAEKKSILFVMTDDTKNCDEVKEYLEARYPDLRDATLVIHTKNNGEISEASTGKSKEELETLRKQSRLIDGWESPYKAIVSVMMLREGWDVQNVTTIVGLRPYKSKSRILPEQTLGRGLRRMFRGEDVREQVSVVGTEAFMEFVESIKSEGVELDFRPMGEKSPGQHPVVVEVERDNPDKDVEALDFDLPVLEPRVYREWKNLEELDVTSLPHKRIALRLFTEEEQREIVFRDINTGEVTHKTALDSSSEPDYHAMVGYLTSSIGRALRLVGGFDVLFGKIKKFIETELFDQAVNLEDPNVLRNLSEPDAWQTLTDAIKNGIGALTVRDRGTTEVRDRIKLSRTRPLVAESRAYYRPKKSLFGKVVGDSKFELEFAAFLDGCEDLIAFAKNTQQVGFKVEYQNAAGDLANYFPDFLVKRTESETWIVETKGREDLDDPLKWERLKLWCEDATKLGEGRVFRPLYVRQEVWENHAFHSFEQLVGVFSKLA